MTFSSPTVEQTSHFRNPPTPGVVLGFKQSFLNHYLSWHILVFQLEPVLFECWLNELRRARGRILRSTNEP